MTPTEKLLKLADLFTWQDISTAPRDGTLIDVIGEYRIANVHWYEPTQEFVQAESGIAVYNIRKWMPVHRGEAGNVIRALVERLQKLRDHDSRWHSPEQVDAFIDQTLERAAEIAEIKEGFRE
jgi:hypothetical protein